METGERIGPYQLRERVGRGGMADIFRAEEKLPDGAVRTLAIKRLFPKLSAEREFVGMFVNEARLASAMVHPNIVRTYDLINYGSYYYIVMEYLEGMDLDELLQALKPGYAQLAVPDAAYVACEVAQGLSYAHHGSPLAGTAGPVVHRDISPGNILIGCDGQVKITDFGIARALQAASFTRPGILKGKYEYMAPEYVKGLEFDGRADLFSLGVVLYEMLTGGSPFAAVLPKDIWERVLTVNPPPPGQLVPEIPREMDAVVVRALAKDPKKRFSSAEEMAAALLPLFSRKGQVAVAQGLGAVVKEIATKSESPTTQRDLEAFLPPEEEPGSDFTQEIHLDELLDLVEPVEAPRPAFNIKPVKEIAEEKTQVKVPPTGNAFRWALVAAGALVLLGCAALTWWLWPEPAGFLWVESDLRAEVFVDGERIGFAPIQGLALPVGIHAVEVRRPDGYRSKRFEPSIDADQDTRLRVMWKKPVVKKPRQVIKKRRP